MHIQKVLNSSVPARASTSSSARQKKKLSRRTRRSRSRLSPSQPANSTARIALIASPSSRNMLKKYHLE